MKPTICALGGAIVLAGLASGFDGVAAAEAPELRDSETLDAAQTVAPVQVETQTAALVPAQDWALPDEYAADPEALAWIRDFEAGLTPRTGAVEIKNANATLDVPEGFYFLGAEDARRVLEDGWGNPPDQTVLGMIFPAGAGPFDEGVWAATVSYAPDGYVSDEDAAAIDYDELLTEMQASTRADNKWREKNGYEAVDIVGWAEHPRYDGDTHRMFWAKELNFGGAPVNTLNYDIRVLGRRGVLVIGFISNIDALDQIRRAAPAVLAMAQFNPGATYDEFVPGKDRQAAYGIAGMVAGVAVAKKTGLIAAIALFAKKFIGLIIAGLAAAGAAFRNALSRR